MLGIFFLSSIKVLVFIIQIPASLTKVQTTKIRRIHCEVQIGRIIPSKTRSKKLGVEKWWSLKDCL